MLLHEYNLCYDSIIIRLFRILLHVRAGHVGGPAGGEGDPRGGGPTSHLRLLASRPRFSFGGNSDRRTDRDGDFCWPCEVVTFLSSRSSTPSKLFLSYRRQSSCPSASESFSLSQWTFSYPSFRTFVPSLFFVISKFGRFAVCRTCRQAGGLAGRLTAAAGRWAGYESLALGAADPLDRLAGRSDLDFRQ